MTTTTQRKSKLSPLQRQQTAPSAFLPFAPHTKATSSAAAAPSPESPPRPNPLSSTIYHRHEARRAKTLENANDERPALVRILAQLGSSSTDESQPSSAQEHHHPEAALVLSHPQQQQHFADANVFSNETTTSTSNTPNHHVTCTAAAFTAGFSSAVGARLTDWVFLNNPSNYSRASKVLVSSSSVWSLPSTAAASLKIRYNGEGSLSLVHPQQQHSQAQHKQFWPRQLLQNRTTNQPFRSTPSIRWSSPSLAPVVLLFGVQAWTEQYLLRGAETALDAPHLKDNVNPNQALSVASVAASGVAGAAFGLYQQVRTGRPCSVGAEAGAAVLYFGAYRLIKGAFSSGIRSNDGGSHNNNASSDPVLSTAVAGAVAGVIYETTRLLGSNSCNRLFLASPPLASPFATSANAAPSLRLVLTRAAPAHAVLFLGYEATQSLLGGAGR